MSAAKDCPFVLSLDAILNLRVIFDKLSSKEYFAAPDSGYKHFRPEFHLPTQLLIHTYNKPLTDSVGSIDHTYVSRIIVNNQSERSATKDGDICYGLSRPYIRFVHDSDHGITRDSYLYGENFIPTQLVLAHANRLSKLTSIKYANRTDAQQTAIKKMNTVIVTSFPATIDAALTEGFQVWNYTDKTIYEDNITAYERLLMELSLVTIDRSSDLPVPKIYHDTAQDSGNDDHPVPPPYEM